MNDFLSPKHMELTTQQRDALRECRRYRVGTYVWKPQTMRQLADLGLAYRTGSGAYALTIAAAQLLDSVHWRHR